MTTDLTARYAKAEALLPHNLKSLISSPRVAPNWIADTETFWYRNTTAAGVDFILVDAAAGTKQPAFDGTRLAEALSEVGGEKIEPAWLSFFGIELIDGAARATIGEQQIEVSLETYAATVLGRVRQGESRSPDGRWAVQVRDHNLYIRDIRMGEERQLTSDGAEAYSYATFPDQVAMPVMCEQLGISWPPLVVWSPDSTRFVTHRLDQRQCKLMHLLRSSPLDGGLPQPMSYRYSFLGDEHLATADYFVFEAETGRVTQAKCEPVLMPFVTTIMFGFVWWNDEATKVYFLSSDRGDKTAWLNELDPRTGEVRVLVEESSKTHITFGPQHQDRNIRVLSTGDVLWWSQRSGWGHLYLYGTDGKITTLTSGEWLVRKVVAIDEENRRLLFTAAGREPGSDIYLQELYSVSLDGGEITTLTSDGLDHEPLPSKSGKFFVDVTSRYDTPAVSVLRDSNGAVVLELERSDASALYEAGFTPPERVVVKAADGVTDIYCAIYKPFDFDPAKKYPVLDEIYPGPQVSCAPLRFPLSGGVKTADPSFSGYFGAVYAALGFAVVVVDGRGSAMRSKAFQDHNRLVGDGQYIDDHVAAIKQLAESRPWMDLDRVGIFGHSGGGYASTRALLQEPDFYKVAVSSSGDHDDRAYHAWWGEKFHGLVDEFDYEAHANVSLVENLKGKLLLLHGEMDDNVTPHLALRLVDALIKANKDFDLLIVPNAEHSMQVSRAYWMRRRWDYFVQHLLGETPPPYRIAEIPFDPESLLGD